MTFNKVIQIRLKSTNYLSVEHLNIIKHFLRLDIVNGHKLLALISMVLEASQDYEPFPSVVHTKVKNLRPRI